MRHVAFTAALLITAMLLSVSCSSHSKPAIPSSAASAAAPGPAAPNAAGTWKWTVDAAGQTIDQSAALTQSGHTLSGTFTDGFDGLSFPIKDGTIGDDGKISFTVVRTFGEDAQLTLNYSGTLATDTISGEVKFTVADQPASAAWLARRAG